MPLTRCVAPIKLHVTNKQYNKALHPTAYSSVRSSLRLRRRVSLVVSPLARSAEVSETYFMKQKLELIVELVPSTSWYNNMRKAVSKADWDKIRKGIYKQHNHKCGICQSHSRLNCHEIWQYDDQQHIQTLTGFIALCDWCHHVKHIGLAGILAKKGELDYEQVIQHFMRVNDCDRETFLNHRAEAFAQWRERSQHEWQVELGEYKNMVAS